jgi:hypothetical protein
MSDDYFRKLYQQRENPVVQSPLPKTPSQSHKQYVPSGETEPKPPQKKRQGKRDNPEYVQRTFYIKRELARKLKARLALEEMELTVLVEDLLEDWLNKFE